MPTVAARTPAQVEAARRNGARSRGPTSPEGKARSSRNALRHGLAAGHLLLEGEDRAAHEELLIGLVKELAPATELEARLVQRLASALWRQDRADRLESKLFAWTATPKVIHGGRYQQVDAEAAFDIARLDALRRYRAEAGREISRILRELRLLRRAEPPAEVRNEPEPAPVLAGSATVAALRLVARNEPDPTPASPARPGSGAERPAAPPPNRAERRRRAALGHRLAPDALPA